jgi:hypothetical protein
MVQAHVIRFVRPPPAGGGVEAIITTSISRWSMCSKAGLNELDGQGAIVMESGKPLI